MGDRKKLEKINHRERKEKIKNKKAKRQIKFQKEQGKQLLSGERWLASGNQLTNYRCLSNSKKSVKMRLLS